MFAAGHETREGVAVETTGVLPERDVLRARQRLIARLFRQGWHPRNIAVFVNCGLATVYRAAHRVEAAGVDVRDDRLFEVA